VLHAAPNVENLCDALVPDGERALERHPSTDAADHRIDRPHREPGLEQARNRAMDRDGVAVTARGDERPHDGIARVFEHRRVAITPGQAPAADEDELAHVVTR
jgi:hypothetical protein